MGTRSIREGHLRSDSPRWSSSRDRLASPSHRRGDRNCISPFRWQRSFVPAPHPPGQLVAKPFQSFQLLLLMLLQAVEQLIGMVQGFLGNRLMTSEKSFSARLSSASADSIEWRNASAVVRSTFRSKPRRNSRRSAGGRMSQQRRDPQELWRRQVLRRQGSGRRGPTRWVSRNHRKDLSNDRTLPRQASPLDSRSPTTHPSARPSTASRQRRSPLTDR